MSGSSSNIFDQMGYQTGAGGDSLGGIPAPTGPGGLPSTQPGMFGVSPSTWQNIAALGAGMVQGANARTADGHLANGTGFAGGFAGGVSAFNQSAAQQAQMRAQMGRSQADISRENAETSQIALQNQMQQMKMPFIRQQMQLQQQMMSDPRFRQMLMSNMGGGDDMSSAAPSGAPTNFAAPSITGGATAAPSATALSGAMHNLEGNPGGGIYTDAGSPAVGPGVHQAALADVNRAQGTNYTQADLAANPQLGLKVGDAYLAQMQARYPGRPDLALAAYNAGPGATDKAVASGGGLAALPQSTQQYVARGLAMTGGMPGGIDPQTALQRAQILTNRANQLEMLKSMGMPVMGDPVALRNQAQKYLESGLAPSTEGNVAAAKAQVEAATAPGIAGAKRQAEQDVNLATEPELQTRIAAGKAGVELGTAGPIQAAKSANSNVDVRPGGEVRITNPDGTQSWVKNPQLEKQTDPNTGQTTYTHISPALPNAPPGTPGTSEPVLGPDGKPAVAGLSPQQHAFQEHYGESLGKDFEETNESAEAAKNSNYLFDNMRQDSKSWDMGQFAPAEAKGRAYLSAMAQLFNIKGDAVDSLNNKLADYNAFNKSSGMLLREAVHDTSSRAAVQEYKLIGESLPHPTTSPQAFGQVADQWQGLNDFRLAKQKFMQSYQGKPQDFEADFNTRVSPSAFMINRMTQTPEGQDTLHRMLANMSQNESGRLMAGRLWAGYRYAKQNNLFDDLPPIGGNGQPQMPPPPGQPQ